MRKENNAASDITIDGNEEFGGCWRRVDGPTDDTTVWSKLSQLKPLVADDQPSADSR